MRSHTTKERKELFIHLLESLRSYQKRNSYIAVAYKTDMSLLESHALLEIQGAEKNVSDLAQCLMVSKIAVSRAITNLALSGRIESNSDDQDLRKRRVSLTKQGLAELLEYNKQADSRAANLAKSLTAAEQEELAQFLNILADGAHAEPAKVYPGEHILRMPIRRLTRFLGLMTDSILASGLSSLHWHLLSELRSLTTNFVTRDLANDLFVDKKHVFNALSRLQHSGLLSKSKNVAASAPERIVLTPRGRAALVKLERNALKLFRNALESLSTEKLARFVQLFERVAYESTPKIAASASSYKMLRLTDDLKQQMQHARRFLLKHLVSSYKRQDLPESLLNTKNHSYVVFEAKHVQAVIEFKAEDSKAVLVNWVVLPSLLKSSEIKDLTEQIGSQLKNSGLEVVSAQHHSAAMKFFK